MKTDFEKNLDKANKLVRADITKKLEKDINKLRYKYERLGSKWSYISDTVIKDILNLIKKQA